MTRIIFGFIFFLIFIISGIYLLLVEYKNLINSKILFYIPIACFLIGFLFLVATRIEFKEVKSFRR